jgi:hypothetical protein
MSDPFEKCKEEIEKTMQAQAEDILFSYEGCSVLGHDTIDTIEHAEMLIDDATSMDLHDEYMNMAFEGGVRMGLHFALDAINRARRKESELYTD